MKGYSRKVCQAVPKLKPVINMLILGMKNQSIIFVFAETMFIFAETDISYRRGGGVFYPAGGAMFTLLYHCVPSSREPMSQRLPHDLLVLFFSLYIKVIWVPHCRYLIWLRYTAMDTHRLASGRPRYISKNWQRIMCGSM